MSSKRRKLTWRIVQEMDTARRLMIHVDNHDEKTLLEIASRLDRAALWAHDLPLMSNEQEP